MKSLLPKDAPEAKKRQIIYEPNSEAVFNAIVPEYLAGLIYGAMSESVASELASRRMMMDAATKNAQERLISSISTIIVFVRLVLRRRLQRLLQAQRADER